MMYLVCIFLSPLYFLIRKKWVGFIINSILWVLAWLTILLFGLGIFFWFVAAVHAIWNLREDLMRQQAQMIAEEIAKSGNKPA